MKLDLSGGREDADHNDVDFVEKSSAFVACDAFLLCNRTICNSLTALLVSINILKNFSPTQEYLYD